MPDDLKKTFDEVAREAIQLSDKLNRENETQFIERLRDKLEVNVVTGKSLAAFQAAVAPVYEYYVERGEITMDEVEAARSAARGE